MNSTLNKQEIKHSLNLYHGTGYNGKTLNSLILHPNLVEYIYIAGGVICISEMNDPNQQKFLRGHDDEVTAIALSHNGRLLASGQKGQNSDILVWDYQNRTILFTLSEHDYAVTFVKFSNDDKLLYSNGSTLDKKIFIWDMASGNIVASCSLYPMPSNSMTWGGMVRDNRGMPSELYQFANCGEKLLAMWTVDPYKGLIEKEVIQTGNFLREYICLAYSVDEKYLYAGTTSGDLVCFLVKNKSLVFSKIICAGGITSVVCLPDNQVVVGGGDGSLVLLYIDGPHCEPLAKVKFIGGIYSLSASDDGVQILASTDKGFIFRVRSADLSHIILNENHTDGVVSIFSLNDSSYIFGTASKDGTVRLWDMEEYSVFSRIAIAPSILPTCLNFTSEFLLSGWTDDKIRCHKTNDNESNFNINNSALVD